MWMSEDIRMNILVMNKSINIRAKNRKYVS